MKKIVFAVILIFSVFSVKAIEFDLKSTNAILYNLDEDTILYEKNSDERVAIASLTKIMTAIVSVENIDSLEEKVTLVNKDFDTLVENNASVAGFKVNEEVTYEDLLYGLLLPSGADAAQALTRLIAGNEENFVKLMNEKAKELGMEHTLFTNETGLDINNPYSTVKDVAIMFKYALNNPTLKKIMTTNSYVISDGYKKLNSTVASSIAAVGNMDYVLGGKTGITKRAGRCLATFAEFNDVNYMLITVGAPMISTPYNVIDQRTIYEYFLNNYGIQTIYNKDDILLELDTEYATKDKIKVMAPEDIKTYLENNYDFNKIKIDYEGKSVIPYNTKEGETLGQLTISYDEKIIKTIPVTLNETLQFDFRKFISNHYEIVIAPVALIGGSAILVKIFKAKDKKI